MVRLQRYRSDNHIDFLNRKRSIRAVKNDELNWPRAIYIAQVYADAAYQTFRNARERHVYLNQQTQITERQTSASIRLKQACEPYETVHEFLQNAAKWLGEHAAIHMWTSVAPEPTFRYGTTNAVATLNVVLSVEGENKDQDVLYVLTNLQAFNCKRHECIHCHLLYNERHSCYKAPRYFGVIYRCESCRKPFKDENERNEHAENCTREICEQCNCVYSVETERESDDHVCGEFYCRSCKMTVNPEHLCCLLPLEIATLEEQREYVGGLVDDDGNVNGYGDPNLDPLDNHKIIVFDIETEATTGNHIPILICAKRSTDMAAFTFSGNICIQQFCEWLFSSAHNGYCVLAHNLSGFDGIFIMKYLETSFINPDIMLRGNKIMCLTVKEWNIRCLDFLLFAPMKLSKLPKALDIVGVEKSYFPHKFSNPQTLNYIGPLVDIKYYSPGEMSASEKTAFTRWYDESLASNVIFNYWNTLVEYCQNDVDILMRAVIKYRRMFMTLSDGIDPFEYTTLPQATFATFRARHLPEDTFGIMPAGGYESNLMQSAVARLWLSYETRNDNDHVRTRFDNGEERVLNFHVDGSTRNRFLEFYGVSLFSFRA